MLFELKLYKPGLGIRLQSTHASSLVDARRGFETDGWEVLSARQLRGGGARYFPLLLFAQELQSLLSAQLSLVESIDALVDKEGDPQVQGVLREVVRSLRVGNSLSGALRAQPAAFPPFFRAAVEASERTGDVADALRRYIAHEQQLLALRNRLHGALVYPAVLAAMGLLVSLFLLGYVVPRFSAVFADRVSDLPLLSGVVIRFGLMLSSNPLLYLGLLLLLLATAAVGLSNRTVRSWLLEQAEHLPLVGDLARKFRLSRVYRSLGMLLRGGTPAVQSLEMVSVLLPAGMRRALHAAAGDVMEGATIAQSLARHGLTTDVALRLLSVGERSGRMGEMLDAASDFLDAEIARMLDRAARLVEPALMLVVGALVGGIVILMYLPIFELADSIR